MLYVCEVNGNDISVIDTKDAVVEVATREDLFSLRVKGVLIAGMTDDSINVCNGAWLEDEFFQCCVQSVNTRFRHKGFKNDEEIFKFLVTEFNSLYKEVHDLKVTPVIPDSMYHFTADCIKEICRLHNMKCIVDKQGRRDSSLDNVTISRVYKNLGIEVYSGVLSERKFFRVVYAR